MNIHDPKLAPKVTTGAIPGSRKTHVKIRPGLTVAMREVPLDKSANAKPLRLYDTSGPYTDEGVEIDVMKGLPQLRRDWIVARGDVEEIPGRAAKPEDDGLKPGQVQTLPVFDRSKM
jgi:phosphomethylpyrimidine synthase